MQTKITLLHMSFMCFQIKLIAFREIDWLIVLAKLNFFLFKTSQILSNTMFPKWFLKYSLKNEPYCHWLIFSAKAYRNLVLFHFLLNQHSMIVFFEYSDLQIQSIFESVFHVHIVFRIPFDAHFLLLNNIQGCNQYDHKSSQSMIWWFWLYNE